MDINDSKKLSKYLNVCENTIKRWIQTNSIPKNYQFDLMKYSNMKINYKNFSFKEKDQFYTPEIIAKYCFNKLNTIIDINKYTFIEPSVGNGSFFNLLPINRRIGIDIEPCNELIKKFKDQIITCDYLCWKPKENNNKYIVIGNPPFGLRGNLALRFINHSIQFADYIVFILPQLFESDGKGSPRKQIKKFNLIYSEKLNTNFYYPDKKEIKINTIFQIWSKYDKSDKYIIKDNNNKNIKIYSLSDGGTPNSTRNKKMINNCDIYLPSTCFGKENMKCYYNFEDLPNRRGYGLIFINNKNTYMDICKNINWKEISFLSTNSAYNLRTTLILNQFNNL